MGWKEKKAEKKKLESDLDKRTQKTGKSSPVLNKKSTKGRNRSNK